MSSKEKARKTQSQQVTQETISEVQLIEEEPADDFLIQDVELLQQHGINVTDINKLKGAGICTIRGIQMTTRKKMIHIKGLSEAKVDKIKEAAAKIFGSVIGSGGFMTALVLCDKRRCVFRVPSGSSSLDRLLGGGFESMAITEVFGEFRCETYPAGKALYIDTENTFRPERLRDIGHRFDLDIDAMLDNILYARAFTSEQQMDLLDMAAAKFHEEAGVFKLLIVDSVMALFRVDFSGRGELAERQQKLAQLLSRLQKISEEYNIAVIITNQMTADPGATMTFQADPKKPIGGHVLAHASTTRVALRKGKGEVRIAKIYDSPELPESETYFAITQGGIADSHE